MHKIRNDKPIALLGFMACGKSRVGMEMSKLLPYPYLDLDQVIEERINTTIANYFKENGEAEFRVLEKEILENTIIKFKNKQLILSLGGGTPCFHNNIKFIKKHALSIYLQAPVHLIVSRLKIKKYKRPLIEKYTDAELETFVNLLLKKRRKYYKQADLKIRVNNTSEQIAKRIIEQRLLDYTNF